MTEWLDLSQGDERAVADFMSRVAALPVPLFDEPIPDPGSPIPAVEDSARLWWKAQLLRKWDAQRRAQQPLEVMRKIEIAGSLLAAGVVLYLSLPYLF